jgi:hypothetical protein
MCDCIKMVNEELAKSNTRLLTTIPWKTSIAIRPLLRTEKLDPKDRTGPITLTAAFCPFCGEEIKNQTEPDTVTM